MSPNDLYAALCAQPFQPFAIEMTTGRGYEIRRPDLVIVGKSSATVGFWDGNDLPFYASYETFPLVQVVRLIPLKQEQGQGGGNNPTHFPPHADANAADARWNGNTGQEKAINVGTGVHAVKTLISVTFSNRELTLKLVRDIELPFVPTSGMNLDFDCDFEGEDKDILVVKIKDVAWSMRHQRFSITCEPEIDLPLSSDDLEVEVQFYCQHGWTLEEPKVEGETST